MNRYKFSVYKGLRRKENKKNKREEEDNGHMMAAGLKRRGHMAAASHVPRPSSSWNYALKPA